MMPEMKGFLLLTIIKLIVVFTVVMVGVAMLTLMERKVCAWMQNRRGPNRVGWAGLLQPAADGLKNILKEETLPAQASRGLFLLAPAMSFIPALMLSAVIPFAAPLNLDFDDLGAALAGVQVHVPVLGAIVHAVLSALGWLVQAVLGTVAYHGAMPMVVADVPIGFLFVLAISSMGIYGIALAGWSSNSKYSLLGGLRASAQMVSYEVAMGMSLIPVLLLAGNVSFSAIIAAQHTLWFVLPLFVSFFIFLVSGFAETNRLPFDLPEAESELIAGYHTEYSAMKFSMFFIAEYSNVVTVSAMVATLFFGGWDIPFTHWDESGTWLAVLASGGFFFIKTFFWIFFVMWIRWTLPRFRYDQLMALGWKVLLPIALAYIMVTAVALWVLDSVLHVPSELVRMGALTVLNLALGVWLFRILDRGAIVSGSESRRRRLEARRAAEGATLVGGDGAPVAG
jgi:NADH-quinone oxidoreductase subunit H